MAERTPDIEVARELLRLVHHHGSVETNVRWLEPSPSGNHENELERLNKIQQDVDDHEKEVRALLE